MKSRWWRKRGWLGKVVCGAAVSLAYPAGALVAEEPPLQTVPVQLVPPAPEASSTTALAEPGPAGTSCCNGAPCCDFCAPAWCDPVSRVPNMFGDFFARGNQACHTLTFSGGGEGGQLGPSTFAIFPTT